MSKDEDLELEVAEALASARDLGPTCVGCSILGQPAWFIRCRAIRGLEVKQFWKFWHPLGADGWETWDHCTTLELAIKHYIEKRYG